MGSFKKETMKKCSVAAAASSFGKKWTIPLLQEIDSHGKEGFNALLKRLKSIRPKILAERLKSLESAGIIERSIIAKSRPERTSYQLREKGRDLIKIIMLLKSWNEKYDPDAADCTMTSCSDCGRYLIKEKNLAESLKVHA